MGITTAPTPIQGRAIVGVFANREKAEAALADLQSAGFRTDEIGVVARTDHGDWSDCSTERLNREYTTTADGMTTGAVAGAGFGSLWALGIAAGALPAIGPVVAGGILGSILASAAAGAAAGGIVGGLLAAGVPEAEAGYYEHEVKSGRVVLTVRSGDRNSEALRILRAHSAENIETSHSTTGISTTT